MKLEDYEERTKLTDQITFFLEKELRGELVEVSQKYKRSLSSIVRTLIRRGLKEGERL